MILRKYVFTMLFYGSCFASNSTVIVTGASGELGSGAARLLASGYDLILTGRDFSKLKKLQEELKTNNSGSYEICSLDFSSRDSREAFRDYLTQIHSPISGFVLITPRPQFYGKELIQDERVWLEVLQSTFTGPIEALKIALPHLSNHGKIVVVAGTTSVQFQVDAGPSCVIRRMWTTYTKALSHQLGPQGITINALSPGIVLTDFHERRIQKKAEENGLSYEDQMQQEVANIPLRSHAKPCQVAEAIKFLLSEESDFINGINLVLDGGSTLSY